MTLKPVIPLLTAYVVLSAATVVVEVVLAIIARGFGELGLVTIQSLVRTVIVLGFAIWTWFIGRGAARGSAASAQRLRIILPIVTVAFIVVLFLLPLPLWVLVEQIVACVVAAAGAVVALTARRPSGDSAGESE